MNHITLQQTSLAIAQYCENKGRPVFTMDFNREVYRSINSGKTDGFLDEIKSLAKRVPVLTSRSEPIEISKSVSPDTKKQNIERVIKIITKYPGREVRFYSGYISDLSMHYIGCICRELYRTGKLNRAGKGCGYVYEVAK
ncbi:hypothetical protein [Acinetobacter puyangensis]|uniref:hypothetical protein n=1 Tax=Acinetobacter puyangensis TaxID=1096779 RepID=UPI003A4D4FC0